MPRVPQSHNSTTPVEKFDNTAYDAVELVAENIDDVILAAGGVDVMALYLGAFETEPTEGKDGADLVSGNFYLDTTSSSLKYWDDNNSVWVESDVDTVVNAAQEAQAARDAAQAAQTGAETAETNATTQASNAASSASASATSASASATSASNASVSEGNAATSANNAANSATAALDSENAANASAGASATSATESENSATASAASENNAAASAVSAANSASQAEAAFDNFDDMYLGRKTVEPTVDNDGNPLQVGASYWHDNGDDTGEQRFWNGASWESPELTATQAAQVAVTARDDAQLSETNAANSASAAGVDANNAGNSATAAANSASAAAASETAAEGFKDGAETAQGVAQSAANAAGLSESNAATSETNAAASEAAAELAASTVTWKVHTRGEAELKQLREQNKDARAASGFDHYGKHIADVSDFPVVNEGMNGRFDSGADNHLLMGRVTTAQQGGSSVTAFPVTHIAGFLSDILGVNDNPAVVGALVKFPEAPNGTVTYNSVTGEAITHVDTTASFAYADANAGVEVVIDRHDMFGGEFFLEEVSVANPFVYPKGMIQSQAPTMNGITTVASARPATYYAVYTSDTGSAGLGVDFWAATDQEKIDMVSDHTNNIFMLSDGRVVQWRMRQRTVAGAGNGDWVNLNPVSTSAALYFSQEVSNYVAAQGIKDSGTGFIGDNSRGDAIFYSNTHSSGWSDELGVFKAGLSGSEDDATAVDGECYFHVWGVVRRLNQGAYHLSFNPLGAAKATDGFWYESSLLTDTASCFTSTDALTGAIGQLSGRDDGRFYDGIYEGGDGGVNDERYSAWDMSSKEEASKVFQKVVNGTFRGEEDLRFTRVFPSAGAVPAGWVIQNQSNPSAVVAYTNTGASVSGEFQMIDLFADPADILARTDLANGWQGGWCHTIPGAGVGVEFTRKALGTPTRTLWNGSSWTTGIMPNFDSTLNGSIRGWNSSAGYVYVFTYTAFAKQTVEADNEAVFNQDAGLGRVWATQSSSDWAGVLLAESLIGKVCKSSASSYALGEYAVLDTSGWFGGKLTWTSSDRDDPVHSPIRLSSPFNDSPAVKALWYQTANNQQVSMNFAWNELVYNSSGAAGNEWGDTVAGTTYTNAYGAINITDGTSTYTNLNGDECLRGSATLSKPIGYTKNQARTGTQAEGVDL